MPSSSARKSKSHRGNLSNSTIQNSQVMPVRKSTLKRKRRIIEDESEQSLLVDDNKENHNQDDDNEDEAASESDNSADDQEDPDEDDNAHEDERSNASDSAEEEEPEPKIALPENTAKDDSVSHSFQDAHDQTTEEHVDDKVLPSKEIEQEKEEKEKGEGESEEDIGKDATPTRRVQIADSELSRDLVNGGFQQSQQKPVEPIAPAKPEPRLVIERLVLINFKSYAGKQVVGPFNASFSAVVGPNGSGKSNVIDSLLFVFGFRASKMRQSKLSELIHNSEAFPNLDFCQVDIHFKTVLDLEPDDENYDESNLDGNTVDIPDTSLVVSRKAFRNNSSKYYINNKEKTYTVVTDLLKGKGIDLDHKRFLILQGEVESIAQMKPKAEKAGDDGLLEYLEDIIGTSKYQEDIETNLKAIDELNDICVDKEMRFEIVEKAKGELEIQKDQALEFLVKEKDLVSKKSRHLQYLLKNDRQKLEKRLEVSKELNEKLADEKTKGLEYKKEVDKILSQYETMNAKIKSINSDLTEVKNVHKKQEREKVSMDEKIKYSENKKKKADKTLNTHQHTLNQSESEQKILQESLENYEKQVDELNDQLVVEKGKLQEIQLELAEKTKDLSKEIETHQKELQPWKDKLDSKQGEIDIATSQLEMLTNKLNELQNESKYAAERLEEIGQLVKSKEKQSAHLKKEKAHVTEQITFGEDEIGAARTQLHEMESEVFSMRQKANDARSNVNNEQSRNRILSALMRLKQSGRLAGFYGRLGDLGVIDDKYDVAVSTGAGTMDEMVVETVETAQQCLDYIRKNNLGFARFIVLTKLRQFDLRPKQTPNNTPRLFDLIQPSDPKFAPAFYSSMYDTLVSDNLQTANKVAFGGNRRWRVVTLDGKLVDTSGTLTGGGNRQFRGAMKLKSKASTGANQMSEIELENLEKDARTKEQMLQEAQEAFAEMDSALQGFKERLPQIDLEVSKLNMEVSSLQAEAKTVKESLKNSSDNDRIIENTSKEISGYKVQLKGLQSEHQKLETEAQKIEVKINKLQDTIMDVGGVKLKMQNSKVDSVLQKLEIVSGQKSKDSSQLAKLTNQVKRLMKQIAEAEKEIATCDADINKIRGSYDERLAEFQRSEKQIQELEHELEVETDKTETLKEELDAKQQKINELRSEEIELMARLEKLEKEVKHYQKLIGEATDEFGAIEVRDIKALLTWLEEDDEIVKNLSQEGLQDALGDEEIDSIDIDRLTDEIDELEKYMNDVRVDLDLLGEYAKRFDEYRKRKEDLNESINQRDSVKETCEDLRKKRYEEFMTGFHMISSTLKEMYQMITMGGNAELELADSLDPFSEGILFSVMPPKKSWRNISNLSGGEKTLSSLALVFALHRYKPTPLYVMDEIDAALDFRNVSIVANYIKERTKNAQFIVISLRNNMFELAKQLVGIYKVSNMTRSITLQNKDIVQA